MTQFVLTVLAYVAIIYSADAAAPSGWTEPTVANPDGNGAISTRLPEDAPATATSIAIQATGATEYVIEGQPTTGLFTIDASAGTLTLTASLDFETSTTYLLTIAGGDGTPGNSGTVTATLSITDVNEVPTFSPATYTASASHGDTGGTSITTVTATDLDAGDSITFSIASGDTNTDFEIDGNGVISVATGKTLDQGTTSSYDLVVHAVDSGTLTASTTVSITVAAAGGAPSGWTEPTVGSTNGNGAISTSLPENTVAGATTITIVATGASAYSITSQPTAGLFTLANTGIMSLATATLDFETKSTYLLTITGGDGSGGSGTVTATLSITNVPEPPVFAVAISTTHVANGAEAGTSVFTVTATDQDTGDTFTYAITGGNTNTDFQVDTSSGTISVAIGKTLDRSVTDTYVLTVTATDSSSLAGTATVSVTFSAGVKCCYLWLGVLLASIIAIVGQ